MGGHDYNSHGAKSVTKRQAMRINKVEPKSSAVTGTQKLTQIPVQFNGLGERLRDGRKGESLHVQA